MDFKDHAYHSQLLLTGLVTDKDNPLLYWLVWYICSDISPHSFLPPSLADDFADQSGKGFICFHSLKNPSYPEYVAALHAHAGGAGVWLVNEQMPLLVTQDHLSSEHRSDEHGHPPRALLSRGCRSLRWWAVLTHSSIRVTLPSFFTTTITPVSHSLWEHSYNIVL